MHCRYTIGNNHLLAVPKAGEAKEEAIKLLKYLIQDEETTKFYFQESAALPVFKTLLSDPIYDDPYAQVFARSAEYADNAPSKDPNYIAALDYVALAMQEALLGGDIEKIAEELQRSVAVLYGQ